MPDGHGRVLVHVAPEDDGPFHELACAVAADLRQVHLPVARVLADGDVEQVVRRVARCCRFTPPPARSS